MQRSLIVSTGQLLSVEPVENRWDPEDTWTVGCVGGRGAGAMASAAFAKIPSKAGRSPPYRYAAAQTAMDEDGLWTEVGGGSNLQPGH
jgi:hypothetical protein